MSDDADLFIRLATTFGTPLYVYRLAALAEAHATLRAALPDPSALYYSVKANPHPELIRSLAASGCRMEISSAGELAAARTAGVPPSCCLYTGPGKTDQEIADALSLGLRRFSVESAAELERLAVLASSAGVEADCLLRMNASLSAAGGLRMTGRPSQFGIDLDLLRANNEICRGRGAARVVGLHQYSVSNTTSVQGLLDAVTDGVRAAAELRDRHGLALTELDLGGGFAAPYAVPGAPPDHGAELRDGTVAALDEHLPGWRVGAPEVAFESGRRLVGPAGDLVCSVTDVKESGERVFVVLDTGIHHVGGLSGVGRLLPVTVRPEPLGGDGPGRAVDLVGPLCSPADVLGRGVVLPALRPGDLLRIPNVGAYGLTASVLAFLGRPAPLEVVVDGVDVVSADALRLTRIGVPLPARSAR